MNLSACAGIIYASSLTKESINSMKADYPNPSPGQNVFFSVFIFLPSILVVIINMVLAVTIRKFSSMEMHKTITEYDSSVAFKLTISMFLNTAVIAIAYHWGDWYKPAGLTQEVYNILIANAIVQPLLTVFSPNWVLKKLLQCLAVRKGERSLLTQQQAHFLFEGVPLDMAQRYASFFKTYLLTLFYAPILPLAYVFGILALILQYWADKFMLLRVHARPDLLSDELDDVMLGFLPVGALLYAGTNMLFFYDFNNNALAPGVVGLVTTFCYIFIPFQKLLKAVWKRHPIETLQAAESESEKTYNEAMVDFVDDYDRCNPVTAEEGKQNWREALRRKKVKLESQERKEELFPGVEPMEMRDDQGLLIEDAKKNLLKKRLGLSGPKRLKAKPQ